MIPKEIEKQSLKLSQLIVNSDEYQNLIKAQDVVKNDPAAYNIVMDYQKLGSEANNKIMQGIALSQKEILAISEQERKIKGNTTVQYWSECQNVFSKMMEDILRTIQQGLTNNSACDDTEYFSGDTGRINLYSE